MNTAPQKKEAPASAKPAGAKAAEAAGGRDLFSASAWANVALADCLRRCMAAAARERIQQALELKDLGRLP